MQRNARSLFVRTLHLFSRARRERDFFSELDAHLQAHIDDNLRAGMPFDETRRRALMSLGGVDQTIAVYRDQRGLPMLEQAGRELRHAFTRLIRTPGFTTAAALSLAFAGGRLIASLLYEVSPRDPVVFMATPIALLVIALAACWLPARRAARVDPLVALRAE